MPDTTTTTNMSLVLPTPSVRLGPTWASDVNTALGLVDAHDHTSGKGVRVPPSGLRLNADVDVNADGAAAGNNVLGLRSSRFVEQTADLAGASDVGVLYRRGSNLFWNFNASTHVQITSGGTLNSGALVANVWARRNVTGNVTILAGDTEIYFDVDTTAPRTVTLPTANAVTAGRYYVIADRNGTSETNAITLTPAGTDLLEGAAASQSLSAQYGVWTVVSDGTSRWRLARTGRLNLAGGSALLTGVLPAANLPDAAAAAKGIVQLAADLGGSSTAPTVLTLTGSGGVVGTSNTTTTLRFSAGSPGPIVLEHGTRATAGAGAKLTVAAQSSPAGGGASGGVLALASGSDGTAAETAGGDIEFQRGAVVKLALTGSGALTHLQIPPTLDATLRLEGRSPTSGTSAGGLVELLGGNAVGTNQNGGGLTLGSGTKTGTGVHGRLQLVLGRSGSTRTMVDVKEVANGSRYVGLGGPIPAAAFLPTTPGDGVVFITRAVTEPSNSVVDIGGNLLWVDGSHADILSWSAATDGTAFRVMGAVTGGAVGTTAGRLPIYVDNNLRYLQLYN